jgi:tetratricopeptide (TPR) repeat protein
MDREAQPSPTNAAKPKRGRSPIERIVTRSFITALLVVVGIEAHSRIGHDRTVTQLRADLEAAEKNGADLNLAAARQKISGLAFQTDNRVNGKGRLTYRWPSLFKTYVVNLSVGAGDDIFALDTDAVDPGGEKPAIAGSEAPPGQVNAAVAKRPGATFGQPAQGFAQPLESLIAVTTKDVNPQGTQYDIDPATVKVVRGVLVRELIRQAFLLSAHEELQQNVRDQSLGEDVGSDENPQDFPYEVQAEIQPTGVLKIQITKQIAGKPQYRRAVEPHQLDTGRFYEPLLEYVEGLSRTTFPEILRESGVTGQPNKVHETADVSPDIAIRLHKIDEMSQLTAIRELHALIRRDGESPERLAALARAYANLGSLTDDHWQMHHKVFKARALLYAQRLVMAAKSSAWAVAHRAYAWALTGRLNTASEDFQQAAAAQSKAGEAATFPRWITDVRAYCEYEPAQLQSAKGDDEALAVYLQVLLADPKESRTEFLDAAQAFVKAAPGCARAMRAVGQVEELGVRRMVAEGGLQNSWPGIYQSLQAAPGLPAQAATMIKKHAGGQRARRDEPADRTRLMQMLKSARDAGPGPSPSVYGLLLEEITFLQATYRIGIAQYWLGLPTDEIVKEVTPTLGGHPYAPYVQSRVSDPNVSRAKLQEQLKGLKPTDLDINAAALLADVHRTDLRAFADLWYREVRHHDHIQCDLLRELQYDAENRRDRLLLHFLNVVAPRLPQSVARRIAADGLKDTEEAKQLETRYDRNPRVLQAIADWYSGRSEFDEAMRCLERRIEIAPESNAYQSLANLYARKNDRVQWKSTLEAALKTPSRGLEHAGIQNELAHYHMHRNELQEALPYAEAAAGTYSGWGLQCLAQCYERLGRMDEAEALVRACSERYDNSSFGWLFWCLRTGQGDKPAARRRAMQMLERHRQAAAEAQLELAIYDLTEKDLAAALTIFNNGASRTGYSYFRLHAALIADTKGDEKARDESFRRIRDTRNLDWVYAEFADLLGGFLAKSEPARWNEEEFWRLLSRCNDGDVTNFYYFAGRFLELHGQPDLGTEYLKLAASSPQINSYNCVLAAVELRARGVEIPACRPFEFGGELAELSLVKDEMNACRTAQQHDRIIELLTKGLVDHPKWAFLLVDRGLAYEKTGKNQEAIADYELAVDRMPDYQPAHHELAMIRAACEDAALRAPAQALVHAQKAFDLAFTKTYLNHTCLAIAFAANGDFEKAVEHQKLAVRIWPDPAMSMGKDRLQLFEEQKPYVRQPRSP